MHHILFQGDSSLPLKWREIKKYVILSVSEISHDLSDKVYAPHTFSVGFFTSFRMT